MSTSHWPPLIDHVQALTRNLLLTSLAPDATKHTEVLRITRELLRQMTDEDIAAAVRAVVSVQTKAGLDMTVGDVMRAEARA
jgi:hypothetical protein